MMIFILVDKIWRYLGFFYLSLILAFLSVFFQKFFKIILVLSLIINFGYSLRAYLIDCFTWSKNIRPFFQQEGENFFYNEGTYLFIESINPLLPTDKTICCPWSTDIAGRYTRQFLYPKETILGAKDPEQCNYLILDYTAGKQEYEVEAQLNSDDKLIFSSSLGKVYQILK